MTLFLIYVIVAVVVTFGISFYLGDRHAYAGDLRLAFDVIAAVILGALWPVMLAAVLFYGTCFAVIWAVMRVTGLLDFDG